MVNNDHGKWVLSSAILPHCPATHCNTYIARITVQLVWPERFLALHQHSHLIRTETKYPLSQYVLGINRPAHWNLIRA